MTASPPADGALKAEHAGSPARLAGWDSLAECGSFYSGSGWLSFSDTDDVAEACYLAAREEGAVHPVAALSAHWSPHENNERYVLNKVLPGLGGIPSGDASSPEGDTGGALIIGGRRGYLSSPLFGAGLSAARKGQSLGLLLDEAVRWRPQSGGEWWWPYLTTEDAVRVGDALTAADPAGVRPRVAAHLLSADCTLDVPSGGLDEHIARLPARQRRTNARRELRTFAESGLRVVRTSLAEHVDTLGPLLANVQQRYGHAHSAEQMTSLLRRQAAHLQDRSVVFLCLAPGDERPVGFCLGYLSGRELAIRVVGFDYDRLSGAAEYAQLAVYEPLRYCQENGLERVQLGMESFEAKCRRGARPRPLWALCSLAAPRAEAFESARDAIAARFPAYEADLFRTRTDADLTRLTGGRASSTTSAGPSERSR